MRIDGEDVGFDDGEKGGADGERGEGQNGRKAGKVDVEFAGEGGCLGQSANWSRGT